LTSVLALAATLVLICAPAYDSQATGHARGAKPKPRVTNAAPPKTLFQQGFAYELFDVGPLRTLFSAKLNGKDVVVENCPAGWCVMSYDPATDSFPITHGQDALSFYGWGYETPAPPGFTTRILAVSPLVAGGAPKVIGESDSGGGLEIDDLATGKVERRAAFATSDYLELRPSHTFVGDFDGSGQVKIVFGNPSTLSITDANLTQSVFRIPLSGFTNAAGSAPVAMDIADMDGTTQPQVVLSTGQVLQDTPSGLVLKRTIDPLYQRNDLNLLRALHRGKSGWAIAAASRVAVSVYDAQSSKLLFTVQAPSDYELAFLSVADVNGDGVDDLLFANGIPPHQSIYAYSGADGSLITFSQTADQAVASIVAGDFRGLGRTQLAWNTYTPGFIGPDRMQYLDVAANSILWTSPWQPGSALALGMGDVSGDGNQKIVFGTAQAETTQNADLYEYDPQSYSRLWTSSGSLLPVGTWSGPQSIAVGDLYGTGTPVIAVGTDDPTNNAVVYILDGKTKKLLKTLSPRASGEVAVSLAIADVMGTGKPQLVIATRKTVSNGAPYVMVIDPATGDIYPNGLFGLLSLSDPIGGMRVAPLGHNKVPRIAATHLTVYALDATNGASLSDSSSNFYGVEIMDVDGDGVNELVAGTDDGHIKVFDGDTLKLRNTYTVCAGIVQAIRGNSFSNAPGRTAYFSCDDKLGLMDFVSGTSAFVSNSIGDSLGLGDQLYLYQSGSVQEILASSTAAFRILTPASSLPPVLDIDLSLLSGPGDGGAGGAIPLFDTSGNPVSIQMLSTPQCGTYQPVVGTPGSFSYQGNDNPAGVPEDVLYFQADNGSQQSNLGAFTIFCRTPTLPTIQSDTYTVAAGGTVSGRFQYSEPHGKQLIYSIQTTPQMGTLRLDPIAPDGAFTYTAMANATGIDHFVVAASNGYFYSMPTTVYVNIGASQGGGSSSSGSSGTSNGSSSSSGGTGGSSSGSGSIPGSSGSGGSGGGAMDPLSMSALMAFGKLLRSRRRRRNQEAPIRRGKVSSLDS